MFCSNCGTKLNNQSNFCNVCGTKIHDVGNYSTKTEGNDTGESATLEQTDITARLIGKNADYYINNWKRPGDFKGWNWVAALFYVPWLGYRKMYKELFNFLSFYLIVNVLFFRLKSEVPFISFFDIVFEILIIIGFGYLGNTLYETHIEKLKIKHLNDPTKFSVESIGGTSNAGLLLGISITIAVGIFFWNYW